MQSGLSAFNFQLLVAGEAQRILEDAKAILRAVFHLLTSFEKITVLGLPLDGVLHFTIASLICLIALRFLSRWKAAAGTAALLVLKEVFDARAKTQFLSNGTLPQVAGDTAGDLVAGVLGMGAALLVARALGERWRARRLDPAGRPLPELADFEPPPALLRTVLVLLVCVSVAIVAGFEVTRSVFMHDALSWLPHLVAAGAMVAACALLGTMNSLVALMALLPFANWLHREYSIDRLNVGNTLILTLLCCEIVRRLRARERTLAFGPREWPLVAYVVYAVLIVTFNLFRLGWSLERAYWLVPPLTGFAVYFVARSQLRDIRAVRRALALLAAALLATCAIGVVEFLVRPLRPEEIPGSVFGSAPVFSVYLSLVWPFVLAVAWVSGGRVAVLRERRSDSPGESPRGLWPRRLLFWPAVVLGAVAVGLVFVRSCWVASSVALLLVLAGFLVRRDWALGLGVMGALVAVAALLVWAVRNVPETNGRRFHSRIVQEVTSIFEPGSYQKARAQGLAREETVIDQAPLLGSTGRSAHMLLDAHAINYGIPGTVLAALAIAAVIIAAWLDALRSRGAFLFAVTLGATAAVAGALLEGMGWSPLIRSSLQPLLWYVLALASAAAFAVRRAPHPALELEGHA